MDNKTQKEPEPLTPFQERVDVGLFFSGARRRTIVEEVKKAIADGVAVITVTGDEGTGKTMICHMVKKELSQEYCCVYLPKTLESFDDVVRVLALQLGTQTSGKPGATQDLVVDIIEYLKENNKRLLAIFDEAERMYLATIERVRKMLDQVNSDDLLYQVIFAGRKNLIENLEQLSICNFGELTEKNYQLTPLGLSETYAYLNHSVQQRTNGKGKNVFTPEAAKKIFSMAQGNLRMTNMLAAKSLEAVESETSFMVLLENVYGEESKDALPGKIAQIRQTKLLKKKWLMGGGLLIVLLAFFFFSGGEKQERMTPLVADQVEKKQNANAGKTAPVIVVKQKEPPPQQRQKSEKAALSSEKQAEKSGQDGVGNIAEQKNNVLISAKEEPADKKDKGEINTSETEQIVVRDKSEAEIDVPVKSNKTEMVEPETVDNGLAGVNSVPAEEGQAEQIIYIASDKKKKIFILPESPTAEEAGVIASAESDGEAASSIGAEPAEESAAEQTAEVGDAATSVDEATEALGKEEEKDAEAVSVDQQKIESESLSFEKSRVVVAPLAIAESEALPSGSVPVDTADAASAGEQEAEGRVDQVSGAVEVVDEAINENLQADSAGTPVVIDGNKKRNPAKQGEIDGAKKIVKIAPVKLITSEENASTAAVSAVDKVRDIEGPVDTELQSLAEKIFAERLAAGESWREKEGNSGHTIQLMALTADKAEENLKKRFEQDEYRKIADNLFILRRNNSRFFVYYGEYTDPDAARQARNTLPVFLRKHDPYPVSIAEATGKNASPE